MTVTNDQGDVLLYQTNDDGDIIVENGITQMSAGLETSAYLSLFGGNEGDDGSENSTNQWWGNIGELESYKLRSRTQYLLNTLPATSQNLLRIEKAVASDLEWMITETVASSISVSVSIPGLNRVLIEVSIEADGNPTDFKFYENWKAAI